MAPQEDEQERNVATNRKARHDYSILETVEAGLVLKGAEVKSLRQGNASLVDGYASIKGGEGWLVGVHINPYEHGSIQDHDPLRPRKLLLHKKEIRRLFGRLKEQGLTVIPLELYFKNGVAKVLLGVAKGKKQFDKRQDISKRDAERAIRQRMARQ
jgi:SsrA-binding protein